MGPGLRREDTEVCALSRLSSINHEGSSHLGAIEPPLALLRRHGQTCNLHVDGAQMVAAGEVQGLPVVAAEGDIGGGRSAVDDAAELLALRVHDPDPTGATAIDIALDIDLHAVGDAGLAAAQIDKDAVGVLCERAVGQQLEGTDVAAPRIVDVEYRLIGREREAVGQYKIVDQEAHAAEIG